MRRAIALAALLTLGACAHKPPTVSPASDPVRVADGMRVPTVYAPAPMALVRLTANGVTSTQTVPANVALAIEFDSVETRWTNLPADDRWYLVKVDGVQLPHAGVLTQTAPAHFRTSNFYTFTPGTHSVDVSLVYPANQVLSCDPGTPGCDNSCTLGQDCYGQPTTVSVQATSAVLTGPPPSVSNGQVIR
jgi:hypothetical protein